MATTLKAKLMLERETEKSVRYREMGGTQVGGMFYFKQSALKAAYGGYPEFLEIEVRKPEQK